MKRLISTLSIIGSLLLFSGCGADTLTGPDSTLSDPAPAALAKKPAPSLQNTITYVFVGHLGITDAEGRRLVWDGEIQGDVEGDILWWFVADGGPPNMPDEAHAGFYEARWEIWDDGTLLLAGESSGSTAVPADKDGIWNGRGRVTETGPGYESWNNRPIFEGGNVDWAFPFSGEGTFRIN